MGFKVGDKVRIKEWEDMVEEFGGDDRCIYSGKDIFVTFSMKEYCGKETEIKGTTPYGNYLLDIDNERWAWPESALLSVEEEQPKEQTFSEALEAEKEAINDILAMLGFDKYI